MNKFGCWWSGVLVYCSLSANGWAGGSGLNVAVVVNQNSTNSVQLGNYYCERRQVPPQNYLRISFPLGAADWTTGDFNTNLFNPLLAMLSSRQLTNQIDYVLLSMDIPYRVTDSASVAVNSTSSSLYYGFKPDGSQPCSLAKNSGSAYAMSEGSFRATPPISAGSNSFLVMMLTSSNLALAKQIVDSGVASDSTFPAQTVYLAKSSDAARNVRFTYFDNAIFNTRLRGNYSMQRTNADGITGFGPLLGAQTGFRIYPMDGVSFVPGSMADNLTSFGGRLFQNTGHLSILSLLAVGAAGSYGTVDEPCNYPVKFPSPLNYFYQARGFSLAECYYQSVIKPYQGLMVGEPLAAPYAQPAAGAWLNPPANALLSGVTNLSVNFTAADKTHAVQQVDLFVDGLFNRTLTNMPPWIGNVLYVTLNGFRTNCPILPGATIKSVTSNLTFRLAQPNCTNITQVTAVAHGDRIELQSFDFNKTGTQVSILASNFIGSGTTMATFLSSASGNTFLDSAAQGIRTFSLIGNATTNSYVQLTVTKTNGGMVSVGVTNTTGTQTLTQMAQQLVALINSTSGLQGIDGLNAQNLTTATPGPVPPEQVTLDLQANNPGWRAAQLTASFATSFSAWPSSTNLAGNLTDLYPRNHLYVTAGATNLTVPFALDTTGLADGYHQLTAVAYEGSHVRTEKLLSQTVRVQNTALSATFTVPFNGTNVAVTGTLQFTITANTGSISNIQLFSTGGSLTNIGGVSSVLFAIPATNLGIGLHGFYAVVTASSGAQYRTDTKWLRLVGADAPFSVAIAPQSRMLTWPASMLRSYDVLIATDAASLFQVNTTLSPTNSPARWRDSVQSAPQRFYRIRASQ